MSEWGKTQKGRHSDHIGIRTCSLQTWAACRGHEQIHDYVRSTTLKKRCSGRFNEPKLFVIFLVCDTLNILPLLSERVHGDTSVKIRRK